MAGADLSGLGRQQQPGWTGLVRESDANLRIGVQSIRQPDIDLIQAAEAWRDARIQNTVCAELVAGDRDL